MDRIRKYKWWLFGLIALGALLAAWERWHTWRENSHDAVILAAARKYGVDPALVKAVVWRESRFNPRAKGSKGEIGLMQIMKGTAGDWAKAEGRPVFLHAELFDPGQNTQAGAWYLAKLLRRYPRADNPLPFALADYNAGRSNVLRWMKGAAVTNSAVFLEQIDFPGTQKYVQSVVKRYQHYRAVFPSRAKKASM